jgi:SAM-dependent methyltransferase
LCQASASDLPLADNSFDAVISFQVIEHVKEVEAFMAEIFRVLKPSGKAFISTPNSRLRLLFFQKPWNPYHVREYNDNQLKNELGRFFTEVSLYGIIARDDLQKMEVRRVKQDIFRLLLNPCYRCLKDIMPRITADNVKDALKINNLENKVDADIAVGLNDFSLSVNTHDCLDLFAMAAKSYGGGR